MSDAAPARMTVEVWSDVVCPWCYIGKRRLERALEHFAHRDEVAVIWRSFELDPGAPAVREESLAVHLAAKYGTTLAQAKGSQRRLIELGAAEGLDFRFDQARSGNTFDAHRLLHLARAHGLGGQLKERLLHAYFTEGEPIGRPEELARLATSVGLDTDEVAAVLAGSAYADAVREEEREAGALGATGVPFFVVDRRYGVPGAVESEVLRSILDKAWEASSELLVVGAAGSAEPASCDGDSCAV